MVRALLSEPLKEKQVHNHFSSEGFIFTSMYRNWSTAKRHMEKS